MITASIVLYNNPEEVLERLMNSFKNVKNDFKLFLIDNSETTRLKFLKDKRSNCEYMHVGENIGFGAGHNIAIEKAIQLGSEYHFVINPDIHFENDVFEAMLKFMKDDSSIGILMPEILNNDGSVQYLQKLLPTPLTFFIKKMFFFPALNGIKEKMELRDVKRDKIYFTPTISGCFFLAKTQALKDVGGFDDNFFMYLEDWDLSRRVQKKYKTLYFPKVSVFHGYNSGANHNLKLFRIFVQSIFIYFNKWGWIFDSERTEINKRVRDEIMNLND